MTAEQMSSSHAPAACRFLREAFLRNVGAGVRAATDAHFERHGPTNRELFDSAVDAVWDTAVLAQPLAPPEWTFTAGTGLVSEHDDTPAGVSDGVLIRCEVCQSVTAWDGSTEGPNFGVETFIWEGD